MSFINSKYNNFTVAVAVVFSICAVVYLFGKQANIMENFSSDREKSPERIKGSRNEVEDRMLISKYRKSYEDTIIELDDTISMTILSEVCENAEKIAKNPTESIAMIRKINDLKAFKDTLNEAMKTLDKK
tara:strand:+ start:220 stop:609 length:390 start_codon:yes stop_codon:yes gene_type:complete